MRRGLTALANKLFVVMSLIDLRVGLGPTQPAFVQSCAIAELQHLFLLFCRLV